MGFLQNFVLVSQRVEKIKTRNEVRDCLDQQLGEWLLDCGFISVPVPNFSNQGRSLQTTISSIIDTTNPSGIVLSGGNDIGDSASRDRTESCLLDLAKKRKIPVLGICRGFQYMNVWAGGTLNKVRNHVSLNHKISCLNSSYGEWPVEVNSYHNFGILNLAKTFDLVCVSNDQVIESAVSFDRKCEGWMWHPERETPFSNILSNRLRRLFSAS